MTVLGTANALVIGSAPVRAVYLGQQQVWARPAYVDAVLADRPSVYWRLNELAGTRAADASHHGRDGTASRVTWGQPSPIGGTAIAVAGTGIGNAGSSVTTPTFPEAETYPFSVELFALNTSAGAWETPFAKSSDDNWSDGFGAYFISPYRVWVGNYSNALSFTMAMEAWTHIVMTYDGATMSVYVNGILNASGSLAPGKLSNAGPLALGSDGHSASGGAGWTGQLDEFAFYDHVLTPAQVAAHYAAATALPKIATFTDSFDTLDPALWQHDPTTTTVNGQLVLDATADYSGIFSQNLYDATESSLSVELVSGSAAYAPVLADATNADHYVYWWIQNGLAQAWYKDPAMVADAMLWQGPYDPVAYRFLRIRESAGRTFWQHSPDGRAWATDYDTPDLIDMTALAASIYGIPPGVVVCDNLNLIG